MPLVLLALSVLLIHPAVASGHELGATQIAAAFNEGRYAIDIAVDPDALLTRLQLLGGEPASNPSTREDRDRLIARLGPTFLRSVSLAFDGRAVDPRFEYRPVSGFSDFAQAPSTVTLSGAIPEGAGTFTVSYGLASGTFAVVARVGNRDAEIVWLESGIASAPISLADGTPRQRLAVAQRYLWLGFTHILPKGLDHILFVIGLFLLNTRWRSVLLQISAFTLAHSITLALTMYGLVALPAKVVEPLIALSIAYVAIENLCTRELKSWRVALVFAFGLLHGMGFAGVLRDLGMPRADFLTALVTFNAGVELGQLTVIAVAALVIGTGRRNAVTDRRLVVQPASIAIALIGGYWTVARLLS
jgi:hypothetical protein